MDAALDGHLIPQQGVDHPVTRGLHLGREGVGRDDESLDGGETKCKPNLPSRGRVQSISEPRNIPEVRLLGRAALHGLVVGVQVGVIVDLQGLGVKCGGDLEREKSMSDGDPEWFSLGEKS